jgi:hypothetical protein
VAAYRAALEERTRDRVPLDWATTQNNLGTALATLGARESGMSPTRFFGLRIDKGAAVSPDAADAGDRPKAHHAGLVDRFFGR